MPITSRPCQSRLLQFTAPFNRSEAKPHKGAVTICYSPLVRAVVARMLAYWHQRAASSQQRPRCCVPITSRPNQSRLLQFTAPLTALEAKPHKGAVTICYSPLIGFCLFKNHVVLRLQPPYHKSANEKCCGKPIQLIFLEAKPDKGAVTNCYSPLMRFCL